jgi:hypothetical protein
VSETKHTPGPWMIGASGPNKCPTVGTHAGLMVAMVTHGENHPAEANARLIAASPDLYRVVKQLQAIMGESQGIAGYHLNGEILTWADFDADGQIAAALAKTEEANV